MAGGHYISIVGIRHCITESSHLSESHSFGVDGNRPTPLSQLFQPGRPLTASGHVQVRRPYRKDWREPYSVSAQLGEMSCRTSPARSLPFQTSQPNETRETSTAPGKQNWGRISFRGTHQKTSGAGYDQGLSFIKMGTPILVKYPFVPLFTEESYLRSRYLLLDGDRAYHAIVEYAHVTKRSRLVESYKEGLPTS